MFTILVQRSITSLKMVPAQGQGVCWDMLPLKATLRQYFFIKDIVLSF